MGQWPATLLFPPHLLTSSVGRPDSAFQSCPTKSYASFAASPSVEPQLHTHVKILLSRVLHSEFKAMYRGFFLGVSSAKLVYATAIAVGPIRPSFHLLLTFYTIPSVITTTVKSTAFLGTQKGLYSPLMEILKTWIHDTAKAADTSEKEIASIITCPSTIQLVRKQKTIVSTQVTLRLEEAFSRKRNPTQAESQHLAQEWGVEMAVFSWNCNL